MKYIDKTWYECTVDKVRELTKEKVISCCTILERGTVCLKIRIEELGGKWVGFDYKPRKEEIIEFNLEKEVPPEIENGSPDIILLLEVIEHLFNPGIAIANISRIAKRGPSF